MEGLIICGVLVVSGMIASLILVCAIIIDVFVRLIHNGTLEPTWRSIPRIWKKSKSTKEFFSEVWNHDRRQIKLLIGI
jgi:hypothetical protein